MPPTDDDADDDRAGNAPPEETVPLPQRAPFVQHVAGPGLDEPVVAGPQAPSAVAGQPPSAAMLPLFDEAQRLLFCAMVNCIVPARPLPNSVLPGAGDLGVADAIEQAAAASVRLRRTFLELLNEVAIKAATRGGSDFFALSLDDQASVLRTVEEQQPARFVALVDHTYRAYYTNPAVLAALGEQRPPQPLGHVLLPFDESLLDVQRRRKPFWRSDAPPA